MKLAVARIKLLKNKRQVVVRQRRDIVMLLESGQDATARIRSGLDLTTEEIWGVNYRALRDLFQISEAREDFIEYEVGVQMIEIHNEQQDSDEAGVARIKLLKNKRQVVVRQRRDIVMQDSLGGHAKTLMFVHINPEVNAIGESISTLKFAERVASIELGAARSNKETGKIKDLKEEISNLKLALEKKEAELEQVRSANVRGAVSPLRLPRYTSVSSLRPDISQENHLCRHCNL